MPFDVQGKLLPEANAKAGLAAFLPDEKDFARVKGLMRRVLAAGEYASWIAPADCELKKMVERHTVV